MIVSGSDGRKYGTVQSNTMIMLTEISDLLALRLKVFSRDILGLLLSGAGGFKGVGNKGINELAVVEVGNGDVGGSCGIRWKWYWGPGMNLGGRP